MFVAKRLSDYPSFNSICWERFYALGRFDLPYNQSASKRQLVRLLVLLTYHAFSVDLVRREIYDIWKRK